MNKYKKDCVYYTRKSNKAEYVTNYCNFFKKYLCGTADCRDCKFYEKEEDNGM